MYSGISSQSPGEGGRYHDGIKLPIGTTGKTVLPDFMQSPYAAGTGGASRYGSDGEYILFYKDWDKYPSAIVDVKTSNKSAVLLAAKLKKKGIKNHAFFLALLDPTLQGVDPYSADLTLDQMRRIGVEVRNNPWYFYREIAKAPARSGSTPDPVEFNRANIALWWSFYNHATFFLTQPRQTGKSFSTDLLMTHLMGFACLNTQINLLTKDDRLRSENIIRLKDIYEELPKWLQFKDPKTDSNNTEEITINALGNSYKTLVPQNSEKRALNAGRGVSTGVVHLDEPPFQPHIAVAMPALLAARGAAVDSAIRNKAPYGIVMTSTAGKKDDRDGRYIYRIISESALWADIYYDCEDEADLRKLVMRNSRSRAQAHDKKRDPNTVVGDYQIYGAFSHRQLGKTDEWLWQKLRENKSEGADADRDFFNRWTSGSQSSPFSIPVTETISGSVKDVEHDQLYSKEGYILRWYIDRSKIETYVKTRRLVCAIDPSDAAGGDDIGMVLIDSATGEVVMVAEFNETNLLSFTLWLVERVVEWTQTVFIIERKSSGVTIIDTLLQLLPTRSIDPFKRLFNWVMSDPEANQVLHQEASYPLNRRDPTIYTRAKRLFGFATSGSGIQSRDTLFGAVLQEATRGYASGINDSRLVQQMLGLVIKNNRVDHEAGEHDDLVVAWLLSHWFLSRSNNLRAYGIDPMSVLQVRNQNKSLQLEDVCRQAMQEGIRNSITLKLKSLEKTQDPMTIMILENEINILNSRLEADDAEINSINAAIEAAKESKRAAVAQNAMRYSGKSRAASAYEDVIRISSDGVRKESVKMGGYGQRSYGGLSNWI